MALDLRKTRIGSHYHEIYLWTHDDGRGDHDNGHDARLVLARMTAFPKEREAKLKHWESHHGFR